MSGNLYVVATPIGNLQDISARAIETLKSVAVIAAEDTRHSSLLLKQFSIHTPMLALHEHNEKQQSDVLLQRMQQGESVALISDAGTPLVSDPGFNLVALARQAQIQIIAIPGPCAAIAALSISGLPCEHFVFEGFLPSKGNKRKTRLEELSSETRTTVLYESVHRIMDLLELISVVCGPERVVTVARELTKRFESTLTLPAAELLAYYRAHPDQIKGEFVVILAGAQAKADKSAAELGDLLAILMEELSLKQSVSLAAKITGQRHNDLYDLALRIKK